MEKIWVTAHIQGFHKTKVLRKKGKTEQKANICEQQISNSECFDMRV